MRALPSETRKACTEAMCSASAMPLYGAGIASSAILRPSSLAKSSVVMPVRTWPGPTPFRPMPAPANSGMGAMRRIQREIARLELE